MFMGPGIDPEKTTNQSPWMGNAAPAQIQPQLPDQQIIVINPKYKPEFNLRIWSTFILLGGLITSFALPFIGLEMDIYDIFQLSSYLCCSSFIIASVMDAIYLKGKSDWQNSMGLSTSATTVSLVFTIIFAVFLFVILFFNFIEGY
jgi:uncharacterized membrane protein